MRYINIRFTYLLACFLNWRRDGRHKNFPVPKLVAVVILRECTDSKNFRPLASCHRNRFGHGRPLKRAASVVVLLCQLWTLLVKRCECVHEFGLLGSIPEFKGMVEPKKFRPLVWSFYKIRPLLSYRLAVHSRYSNIWANEAVPHLYYIWYEAWSTIKRALL